MALKLTKGGSYDRLDLSKDDQVPTHVQIGLGWNPQKSRFVGQNFDLDAQALVVSGDPRRPHAPSDDDYVFFNQPRHPSNAIWLSGDDTTGEGSDDDEVVSIDLTRVPHYATGVLVLIDIHDGPARHQSFKYVGNAYARVMTRVGGRTSEVQRLDLDDSFPHDTTVVIGGVFRSQPGGHDWKFQPLGQGWNTGLTPVLRHYGLNV